MEFSKKKVSHLNVQGEQLNMTVFFWYFVKSDMSSVRRCTLDKSQDTKNTALFNWSPCMEIFLLCIFVLCFLRQVIISDIFEKPNCVFGHKSI